MSLVNDMLLDLESRKNKPEQEPHHGLQPARQAPLCHGFKTALCVGGLCLIVLSAMAYRQLSEPQNPLLFTASAAIASPGNVAGDVAGNVAPSKKVAPDISRGMRLAQVDQKAQLKVESTVPVVTDTVPAESGAALEELLVAADQALMNDRLTQPPVTNAYALYRHVLLLQADNPRAREGIAQIQKRYAQLIQNAIKRGNLNTAQQYLQRAEFVGTPAAQMQDLKALHSQARTQLPADKSELPGEQAGTQLLVREAPGGEPLIEETFDGKAFSGQKAAKTDVGSGSIEVSWRSREASTLTRASLLLQKGDPAGAITGLRTLVANYPQAESAALMLFDVYLQTGKTTEAAALQTVAQTAPLRYYYQARLLAIARQNDEALSILEQLSPSGAVRQPYLALQAGLYQRNAQFERAADLYRQLVEMDNRQPTYWLGLGVAAEALGHRRGALQAFVAADQLAPADPAVDNYIKQRIQALSNE